MAKINYKKAPGKVIASAALISLLGAGGASLLLDTVTEQEGYVDTAYKDPVGVLTICYGDIADVKPGDSQTFEQCARRLNKQLVLHGKPVFKCVPELAAMPDQIKAAFVDMAYNIGPAGFCSSSVAKYANNGQWREACERMSKIYTTARDRKTGKRVELPGLVKRRGLERQMCLSGLRQWKKN